MGWNDPHLGYRDGEGCRPTASRKYWLHLLNRMFYLAGKVKIVWMESAGYKMSKTRHGGAAQVTHEVRPPLTSSSINFLIPFSSLESLHIRTWWCHGSEEELLFWIPRTCLPHAIHLENHRLSRYVECWVRIGSTFVWDNSLDWVRDAFETLFFYPNLCSRG